MTIDQSKITMKAHQASLSRLRYLGCLFLDFADNFLSSSTNSDFYEKINITDQMPNDKSKIKMSAHQTSLCRSWYLAVHFLILLTICEALLLILMLDCLYFRKIEWEMSQTLVDKNRRFNTNWQIQDYDVGAAVASVKIAISQPFIYRFHSRFA